MSSTYHKISGNQVLFFHMQILIETETDISAIWYYFHVHKK